jgi:hypothetical protein
MDGFRRNKMLAPKHAEIGRDGEDERDTSAEDIEAAMDDDLGDELLSLIFTVCHPVLFPEARGPNPAPDWRTDYGRDRPRPPLERSDHYPAHRPGQERTRYESNSRLPASGTRAAWESICLNIRSFDFSVAFRW